MYNACSVHKGVFNTSGRSHRRDTTIHVGDIMSTLGDIQYIGGLPRRM